MTGDRPWVVLLVDRRGLGRSQRLAAGFGHGTFYRDRATEFPSELLALSWSLERARWCDSGRYLALPYYWPR